MPADKVNLEREFVDKLFQAWACKNKSSSSYKGPELLPVVLMNPRYDIDKRPILDFQNMKLIAKKWSTKSPEFSSYYNNKITMLRLHEPDNLRDCSPSDELFGLISQIPTKLPHLMDLHLVHHSLTTVPESFRLLRKNPRLRSIILGGWRLTQIPDNFFQGFSNIKSVRFVNCTFSAVPSSLFSLSKLQTLEFINCPNLSFLPDRFNELSALDNFSIRCCPNILTLPPSLAPPEKWSQFIYVGTFPIEIPDVFVPYLPSSLFSGDKCTPTSNNLAKCQFWDIYPETSYRSRPGRAPYLIWDVLDAKYFRCLKEIRFQQVQEDNGKKINKYDLEYIEFGMDCPNPLLVYLHRLLRSKSKACLTNFDVPEHGVEVVVLLENPINIAIGKVTVDENESGNESFVVQGHIFDLSTMRFMETEIDFQPKLIARTENASYSCYVFERGLITRINEHALYENLIDTVDLAMFLEKLRHIY
jgi:hypothetical protein